MEPQPRGIASISLDLIFGAPRAPLRAQSNLLDGARVLRGRTGRRALRG
jgi:hypothetical protein